MLTTRTRIFCSHGTVALKTFYRTSVMEASSMLFALSDARSFYMYYFPVGMYRYAEELYCTFISMFTYDKLLNGYEMWDIAILFN